MAQYENKKFCSRHLFWRPLRGRRIEIREKKILILFTETGDAGYRVWENVVSSLYKQSRDFMLRSQSWPRLDLEEDGLEVVDTILVTEPHQVRRAPASVLVSQRNGIFYSLDEGDQAQGSERGLPGENKGN